MVLDKFDQKFSRGFAVTVVSVLSTIATLYLGALLLFGDAMPAHRYLASKGEGFADLVFAGMATICITAWIARHLLSREAARLADEKRPHRHKARVVD